MPAPSPVRRRALLPLMLLGLIPAARAATYYPPDLTETCELLASIAYHAASAPLSKTEARWLAEEKAAARRRNGERAPIDPSLIAAAQGVGEMSHGNRGDGLTRLGPARGDGFVTALMVQQGCLASDGKSVSGP